MDKKLLKIVDKITSIEFVVADFVCFAVVPLVLSKFTKIKFSETDCMKLIIIYIFALFVDCILTNVRLKDFLKRYYPLEFSSLYGSDSILTIFRGPFGNLHANMYINKVLDNPEWCDDIVYILYEQLLSKRKLILVLEFAGTFFIFFLYTFISG